MEKVEKNKVVCFCMSVCVRVCVCIYLYELVTRQKYDIIFKVALRLNYFRHGWRKLRK